MPDVRIPPFLVSAMGLSPAEAGRTWLVEDVGLPAFWESLRGKVPRKVKVAVLDTGIDKTHAESGDLSGAIKEVRGFTGGNVWQDGHGHGTHCASIVCANDDGATMAGVAAGFVDLYVGKVLTDEGNGSFSGINAGIQWAIERGVDVLSMSLGGPVPHPQTQALLRAAAKAGLFVVCAAGNEGERGVSYPGAFPDALCVGAVDRNKQIASWSSRGEPVDLVGYGVDILGCWTGGRYATLSGTSMATPFVAGLCALRRAADLAGGREQLTGSKLLSALPEYCEDLGDSGDDHGYGHGFILPSKLFSPTAPPQGKFFRIAGTSIVIQESSLEEVARGPGKD